MVEMTEKEERFWAMLCHFSIFVGHFIPFGNIIAPLIIWLMKKNESSFVDHLIAGVKANDGEWYRYPLTIRFIK